MYVRTHSFRTLPRSVYEIAPFVVVVVVVGPPGRPMAALTVLPSSMPPSVSSAKGACRNIPRSPPRLHPRPTPTPAFHYSYCSFFPVLLAFFFGLRLFAILVRFFCGLLTAAVVFSHLFLFFCCGSSFCSSLLGVWGRERSGVTVVGGRAREGRTNAGQSRRRGTTVVWPCCGWWNVVFPVCRWRRGVLCCCVVVYLDVVL